MIFDYIYFMVLNAVTNAGFEVYYRVKNADGYMKDAC